MIKRVLLTITVLAGVFCGVLLVQKVGKWKLDYDILHAAAGGDADEIKRLLDQGANPNAEHIEGTSALWCAVASGKLKAVQTLLDHGANPNSCGQFDSVLHDAINIAEQESSRYKDSKAIVQVLIARGALIHGQGCPSTEKPPQQPVTRKPRKGK